MLQLLHSQHKVGGWGCCHTSCQGWRLGSWSILVSLLHLCMLGEFVMLISRNLCYRPVCLPWQSLPGGHGGWEIVNLVYCFLTLFKGYYYNNIAPRSQSGDVLCLLGCEGNGSVVVKSALCHSTVCYQSLQKGEGCVKSVHLRKFTVP